jgi:hypothetical protein
MVRNLDMTGQELLQKALERPCPTCKAGYREECRVVEQTVIGEVHLPSLAWVHMGRWFAPPEPELVQAMRRATYEKA